MNDIKLLKNYDEEYLNTNIIVDEQFCTKTEDAIDHYYNYDPNVFVKSSSFIAHSTVREIHYNPKIYDWTKICRLNMLSEVFLRDFVNHLDWWNVCIYQKLSEKFIYDFYGKVYWMPICQQQKLSEKLIEDFKDKVSWGHVARNQVLSKSFIIKYLMDKVEFTILFRNPNIDEETKNYIRMFI